jgi:hypothetical protein
MAAATKKHHWHLITDENIVPRHSLITLIALHIKLL